MGSCSRRLLSGGLGSCSGSARPSADSVRAKHLVAARAHAHPVNRAIALDATPHPDPQRPPDGASTEDAPCSVRASPASARSYGVQRALLKLVPRRRDPPADPQPTRSPPLQHTPSSTSRPHA
ncbi:hypothetical protein B0H15DRAFT_958219 [Mycena belliarum]|uniref:Uncharacterized protein n=1 Tax=Mycena belliarum TaxID=1033014 RepID=A0AAD6XKT7_9AGAR|nr:hypothetical protein B0H15DRAFT_958219 [Mycena belliae]